MLKPKVFFSVLVIAFLATGITGTAEEGNDMQYNDLTPQEEQVILNKGTEPPFSGEYVEYHEDGTYTCKRCDAPLFRSESKFDSHSGWPSFDDAIEGAVKLVPDQDGRRTEVVCARCGGHLGHVFTGEGFTEKNIRYCVNSVSLDFLPAGNDRPARNDHPAKKAVFAGGCFWGVEYYFRQAPGVLDTRVGYTGGHTDSPTYEEVCSDTTGHVEAIEVTYDPARTTYEDLARLFFEIHDPTQVDRQGPDIGEQYKSVIFYRNDEQKKIAEKLIGILESKGYDVTTELRKAGTFWEAEEYHQDYYAKTGKKPYCHVRTDRF
jgi:peptide methionine sulfoxide reductase msrA/msrB